MRMGGLHIRKLGAFNFALLSKRVWHFLKKDSHH